MQNKSKTSLSDELMKYWIEGWPEYTTCKEDDNSSIIQMHYKIYSFLNLDPKDPKAFDRVCVAVTRIARYCKFNYKWACRNIYYANMCFQTLRNEMAAKNRMQAMQRKNYRYNG